MPPPPPLSPLPSPPPPSPPPPMPPTTARPLWRVPSRLRLAVREAAREAVARRRRNGHSDPRHTVPRSCSHLRLRAGLQSLLPRRRGQDGALPHQHARLRLVLHVSDARVVLPQEVLPGRSQPLLGERASCIKQCFPQGVPLDCRHLSTGPAQETFPSLLATYGAAAPCGKWYGVVPGSDGLIQMCQDVAALASATRRRLLARRRLRLLFRPHSRRRGRRHHDWASAHGPP